MDDTFDCIIVGGGVAGLSAAMTLARSGLSFLLVERGEFPGAKNVSGGILWGEDLSRLVPGFETEEAGWERYINHRRLSFLDSQSAFSLDFKSERFDTPPWTGISVLRSRFDRWLAEKTEAAISEGPAAGSSLIATGILVDEILIEEGRAVGIRAGGESFPARSVILAEGVNNLLTRQVGLQHSRVPDDSMLTGVKEIIRFDRQVLENRFQLRGQSGVTYEFVGDSTLGVEGGGFLYTNRDSVSIGLVLGLHDLREKGHKPYDILSRFKEHPVIRDMIAGGETVEYSSHVVSSGDRNLIPKELCMDGLLVCGEAAHLLMNNGRAIQGMDFAMRSGMLAAETILEAHEAQDFGLPVLKGYQKKLDESFVMKQINGFQGAVELLHDPVLYRKVPPLLCSFGQKYFSVRNEPSRKARRLFAESVKEHASWREMIQVGIKGLRSL
ncbi:MAG: FAD-dependent oxidoreductase [Balneolaceae bacterium]